MKIEGDCGKIMKTRKRQMKNSDWKKKLTSFFEDIRVIEICRDQTLKDFDQFCEFIAEPAFESLAEELQKQRIKSKYRRSKKKSIDFQINFGGSRIDQFHYVIELPKNSIELRPRLLIKGRKNKEGRLETTERPFLEGSKPEELLKLSKEKVINDVIEHYRNFIFESIARC
jgi:hypothetical protein